MRRLSCGTSIQHLLQFYSTIDFKRLENKEMRNVIVEINGYCRLLFFACTARFHYARLRTSHLPKAALVGATSKHWGNAMLCVYISFKSRHVHAGCVNYSGSLSQKKNRILEACDLVMIILVQCQTSVTCGLDLKAGFAYNRGSN